MSSEFNAAVELIEMLVLSPRTGVLMGLLVVAAFTDIRTGRIPNWLVFGGAVYGLAYNAFFPPSVRDVGIVFALGGLALGLGALLPLYLLRAMGAGDVKLMAMTGAFLGASVTFGALIATLIAGGVLAIGVALFSGRLVRMLRNIATIVTGAVLTLPAGGGGVAISAEASAGKMPYGVAIAAGAIGYLVLAQLGLIEGVVP